MAQARHAGKIVLRYPGAASWTPRPDATYLISGGLSGLGLQVAQWLADQGAERLVLIGRRAITAATEERLGPLRAAGADVMAESLDVSDEAGLRALLGKIRAQGPPLRGVWHSAGVLDDAGLLQQDERRYERVFAPKVMGGFLLDALTRSDPLDCFVIFSSAASVLGSTGQSNHCAANAFLDLLAHERASRGLPALSINWGPWTDVGAAADRGITDRLAAQGFGAVTPAQGLNAMQRLMQRGATQAAVVPIDWKRYGAQAARAGSSAFVREVAGALREPSQARGANVAAAPPIDLRTQLREAREGRRRPMLATFVRECALRALGLDPARTIDPRTPLGELGLDSLLSVELRNTLGRSLGEALPATLLFDYPTIAALTDYLFESVLGLSDAAGAGHATKPAVADKNLVGSIEDLSDDDVDRLLAQRSERKGSLK